MKTLSLLLLAPLLSACSNSALLVANTLARFDSYSLTVDQNYGIHAANKLDVYQPKEKAKGTIVFFYGGCWGACSTFAKDHYRFVAQALTTQGYRVVIPDYRHYPEVGFAEIMYDSANAVRWVLNQFHRQEKNPVVFLMGHSAGGHIAAMLTVNEEYLGREKQQKIRGFIGLSAPYDFIFDKPYLPKVFANMEYIKSQPSHFVTGNEAPLLLLYGDQDQAVYRRNIINMAKKVKEKKGQVETHIYPNMNHTDMLAAFSIPYRNRFAVLNDIATFLKKWSHD
ncbi:MAG: alpha/beta hydrolase [Gammaproteobacteria bacterium]|nr:alpha/beta hydrolase [Gammaproteobacteria bacterium]